MQRLIYCGLSALVLACGAASAAAEGPLYNVYISQDGTVIRSGPGDDFYITDRLGSATKLEVYREEADGWLAIRPPAGSFSWVPGPLLRSTDEPSLAEVTAAGARAWVGSRTERVREHRSQIKLQRGEVVEVLAQRQYCPPGSAACQRWYKIAPPAGEFRYVHRRSVSREPLLESTDNPGDVPIEVAAFAHIDQQVARASHQQPASAAEILGPIPSQNEDSAPSEAIRIPEAATAAGGAAYAADAPAAALDNATAFLKEVDRIDYELSLMVAKDVATWDLDSIKKASQALLDRGETAPERGRARLLLERVEEFYDWRDRFLNNLAGDQTLEQEPADEDLVQSDIVGSGVRRTAHATQPASFDGSGWLMPVHSDQESAPPYALVDADGTIIQFVSPAPGLNLHRYVEKEVGIIGKAGYANEMKTPHLTALRVVELARHR